MNMNTDVRFNVVCLDEEGNAKKHSIEIKKGKIRTECRRARCEEVRKIFLYYVGFSYDSTQRLPRGLRQHFDMCKDIRWHRQGARVGRDRKGWKPTVSQRMNTLLDKLYPGPVHWRQNTGFRAEQMLFLHSFFKKQAPGFDWWETLLKEWSPLNLGEREYSLYNKHWTILVFNSGEELVLTFSLRNSGPHQECGFWFRKEDQQYSCTTSAVRDTGRPYHVGPPS